MASVYEEIERILKAKEDIEDAIESCGVTVPDTELIDKYANYIRSIPNNIFSNLNVDTIGGGDTFIRSIEQTNGKINANIGGIVSNTESGIVPKIDNSNNSSITDQAEEWVLTSDKGATPTWKQLPINAFLNENDDTTYTLSGSLDNNNYNITLTSSSGSNSGVEISCMGAASSNNAGTAGLVPAPTKGKQTSFLRGDGTWAIPTNTTYSTMTLNEAKTGTATTARTITAKVLHDKISTMIPTNMDWSNITNKPSSYNPSAHNHSSEEIISLTNYIKATGNASLSNNDTLNSALGKLEYKADLGISAYDIISAASDGDGVIENLTEILKILEGISDTDTIQAIVNKYLPLSGGTMSGNINFGSDKGIYVNNSYAILALGSKGKFTGHPNDEESYTFVGTTNYNTIIRTKNKLQIYKNSNRYNIIDSSGGIIDGSLTWEIPDYSITPIIRNIKFTETTGWARNLIALQVDGKHKGALGAYGSYTLNSTENTADYFYLGFNSWNGNNLRVYPDGITFGDKTIWHSGNCNFLSSTNKNLTPAGSEITNAKIGELIGYQAINKSTWAYANNGYIETGWGKMELAGSSILSFGTSSAYTQLFISAPSSSRGDGLTNEMMFYNNHGSTYSPGWTRVITNRNYSNILNNTYLPLAGGKMTGPIVFNGTDTDRIIMRINSTTGESTKTSDYGFTFKFLGSGTGDNNSFALFSDNQTNTSQNKSFEIKQSGNIHTRSILPLITDGTLGTSTNRWNYVYARTYYVGGTANNTTAILTSDATDNIYLSVNSKALLVCNSTNNTVRSSSSLKNTINLGTDAIRWNNIYGITGNFGIKDKIAGNSTAIADRLTLIPPGHTGGNWCIGIDDTSSSFSKLYFKYKDTTNTYVEFGILSDDIFTCNGNTIWHTGNDSGLLTDLTSSSTTNLSITVGGTTESVTELYSTYTERFKKINNTQNLDLNTGLVGGALISNYNRYSSSLWQNAPSDMQYGTIIEFSTGYTSLSGQLAWDINHNSTTNTTRCLYWRAADTNGFGYAYWKKIAFIDDITDTKVTNNTTTSTYYLCGSTSSGNTTGGLVKRSSVYVNTSSAIYASGGFYESSDERLKNIINPIKIDLDKLSKLRKVNFLWNSNPDKGIQLGVIALDIQKLFPEIVTSDSEKGYLSIAYDKLSVIALAAIDKLYEENKKLKERLNILENKIK